MPKKLSDKEIKERFKNEFLDYELKSEYINGISPIKILHKPCGTIYEVKRAKSFLKENKCKCPNCKENNKRKQRGERLTEKLLIKKIFEEVGNEYTYIGGFIDNKSLAKDKVILRHNKCGKEWKVRPDMFLGKKQTRCPYCANLNRGKYLLKENYLYNLLNESNELNNYQWLEDYKGNNKIKHKIKHLECGNIYEVKPNDFQQGYRCPKCSFTYSKGEEELYLFIKSIYKDKIIKNYKDKIEIDIYLPNLKIGFEYNGYFYHSDKFKDKNYHLNKYKYFKEKGIRIFFIDEYDWLNKNEILKSKISHILNLNDSEIIYARNCEIEYELSNNEIKEFLNKNHIQGYCQSSIKIGLKFNKKIIALITFGKSRINTNSKNKKKEFELLRYCTDINYRIVGGFSKLLNYSIKYIKEFYEDIEYINTYADLSLSDGNMYLKNNFIFDHLSKPSYNYIKVIGGGKSYKLKKINRFTYRKSELKKLFPNNYSEEKTEIEIIDEIENIFRIWNIGNLYFKYKI